MIQLYWCELLNLEHQFIVIDYKNNIANRPNWIHADLNFEDLKDQENYSEMETQFLTNPTQEEVIETQKEMKFVMLAMLETFPFIEKVEINQRRREFAITVIEELTTQFKNLERLSPELLMNVRNTMISNKLLDLLENNNEIMIFYGAAHMISIEKILLDAGFKLMGEKRIEVFDVNLP